MERIKETMDECIQIIQRAPPGISKKLGKLFRKLDNFLKQHPEFSDRTLPIILKLQNDILEGDYVEALIQLFHLLVLIALWERKK